MQGRQSKIDFCIEEIECTLCVIPLPMHHDSLSMTDIHHELTKLHEEFITSIQQDRDMSIIQEISGKIDRLLRMLTIKTDSYSPRFGDDKKNAFDQSLRTAHTDNQ